MYCLSVYLIQIQSYRAFSNMALDHWCLSLRVKGQGWYCTKPLSTIQCNKTLCRDQLVPILLIG